MKTFFFGLHRYFQWKQKIAPLPPILNFRARPWINPLLKHAHITKEVLFTHFLYDLPIINKTRIIFATSSYTFINKMLSWATYMGPVKIQTKKTRKAQKPTNPFMQ